MKKRAKWQMVDEDDEHFARFWTIYPRLVAKKDARKAWAKLNPSPELVEKIMAALEWQIPAYKWDGDSADYAPYPASWLNAERWTDERRQKTRPQVSQGAQTVLDTLLGGGINGRGEGSSNGDCDAGRGLRGKGHDAGPRTGL
jgi:hypothetical protein